MRGGVHRLVSLAMDMASNALLESHQTRAVGQPLAKEERVELKRRRGLWVFYLLRSPCFENFVLPPLERLRRGLEPIPIAGSVYGQSLEIMRAIQAYYFYTACS